MEVINDPSTTYKLGNKQTSKMLKIQHGELKKPVQMSFISNSPFLDSEFIQWKKAIEKANIKLIEKERIVILENKIKDAQNYKYKDEEIDEMVIKNRMDKLKKGETNFNVTLEISQVTGQLGNFKKHLKSLKSLKTDKADKRDNSDKIARYKKNIQMLKEELKILQELKQKRYDAKEVEGIMSHDTMVEFNKKSKIKQQTLDSQVAMLKKDDEDKKGNYNPFSRRHCQPQIMWQTKGVTPQMQKQ